MPITSIRTLPDPRFPIPGFKLRIKHRLNRRFHFPRRRLVVTLTQAELGLEAEAEVIDFVTIKEPGGEFDPTVDPLPGLDRGAAGLVYGVHMRGEAGERKRLPQTVFAGEELDGAIPPGGGKGPVTENLPGDLTAKRPLPIRLGKRDAMDFVEMNGHQGSLMSFMKRQFLRMRIKTRVRRHHQGEPHHSKSDHQSLHPIYDLGFMIYDLGFGDL